MDNPALFPDEIYFYGKNQSLPEQHLLKAGPLSLVYVSGAIRYVKLNNAELVRMIYSAVRDHNWDTISPSIKHEKINDFGDSFFIEYDAEYKEGDIHFVCKYRIEGTENGEIRFNLVGSALSTFMKNRIGFCVLHPVEECLGRFCEISDVKGKKTVGIFPQQISPHQPFKQIKSMRWQIDEGLFAKMDFEGEIFEMEDQRNWTDASFKTYSTPLEIPFPVKIQSGTRVNQSVRLGMEGIPKPLDFSDKNKFLVLNIFQEQNLPLSEIGIGRSGEVSLSSEDIHLIAPLGFHHYRIDVRLFEAEWEKEFRKTVEDARLLKLGLEIILHFQKENFESGLTNFIEECRQCGADIYSMLLLQEGEKTSPSSLLDAVSPELRKAFPKALLGGGTDIYFTEINRNRPDLSQLDFLSFSINPQVHAFDNSSLCETLQAQVYVVQSAQKIWPDKSVHISPVSLKPRFNPNATGPEPSPLPGELPVQTDVRQMSLFGAGWTLGSIKYLCEAGAKSITYYETLGSRGILMGKNGHDVPGFPTPYDVFPMYVIFREVLEFSGAEILKSKSSEPLKFDALVLRKNKKLRIILANFLNKEIKVKIPFLEGKVTIRQLDVTILKQDKWFDNYFKSSTTDSIKEHEFALTLPPYAIVTLDAGA